MTFTRAQIIAEARRVVASVKARGAAFIATTAKEMVSAGARVEALEAEIKERDELYASIRDEIRFRTPRSVRNLWREEAMRLQAELDAIKSCPAFFDIESTRATLAAIEARRFDNEARFATEQAIARDERNEPIERHLSTPTALAIPYTGPAIPCTSPHKFDYAGHIEEAREFARAHSASRGSK